MLRRCTKCGLPETYETIEFDALGVCNICRQKHFKDAGIDWAERGRMLVDLIEEYRGKYDYDCVDCSGQGGRDTLDHGAGLGAVGGARRGTASDV